MFRGLLNDGGTGRATSKLEADVLGGRVPGRPIHEIGVSGGAPRSQRIISFEGMTNMKSENKTSMTLYDIFIFIAM